MSINEIQARIATIQSQFIATAASTAAKPARSAPAQGPSFADALADVQAELPAGSSSDTSFGDAAGTSFGHAAGAAWASRLPAEGRAWAGQIEAAAKAAGVDPRVVAAVAWTESGFKPDAASGAGARGLMQLMPSTAAGLGVDPDEPRQNLAGGARYLAQQIQKFGRLDLALAAYNAGPGAVQRHGGIPPYPETKAYVGRVLDRLRSL